MQTKSRPRKQTTRQRKVECLACGCIVRMSRQAMLHYGLPTCACGVRMLPADVEDAALLGPDVLHEHPDFRADEERFYRKAVREHTCAGGARHRCHGCRRFLRAANEACDCGFWNDIRGGRNYGRWASGMSRAKADLPF